MEQLRVKSLYPDASCPHEPTQICSRDGKGSANQVRSQLHTACISVPPDRESGICHRIHQPPPKKLQVQRKKRNETSTCMSICAPVCPSICPSVTLCIHLYTHVSIWASLCACASICVSIYACTGIYISSVCLSACLPAHLCACLCMSLCPSVCQSVHPSVCPSVHPFVCPSAYPSVHPPVCPSVPQPAHLSALLCICLGICLSVHPCFHLCIQGCTHPCVNLYICPCPAAHCPWVWHCQAVPSATPAHQRGFFMGLGVPMVGAPEGYTCKNGGAGSWKRHRGATKGKTACQFWFVPETEGYRTPPTVLPNPGQAEIWMHSPARTS